MLTVRIRCNQCRHERKILSYAKEWKSIDLLPVTVIAWLQCHECEKGLCTIMLMEEKESMKDAEMCAISNCQELAYRKSAIMVSGFDDIEIYLCPGHLAAYLSRSTAKRVDIRYMIKYVNDDGNSYFAGKRLTKVDFIGELLENIERMEHGAGYSKMEVSIESALFPKKERC